MNKNLIITVASFICTACSTTQNIQSTTSDYTAGINNLSETELNALTQIKADINDFTANGGHIKDNRQAILQIKEEDWQSFDLYEVDVNKFFQDPKPERIEQSINKPIEAVMLTSKDVNSITFTAKKIGERWRLEGSYKDSNVKFAWIKKVISNATDKSYKVLSIGGRHIFAFKIKDELTFYYPNGKPMSYDELYRFMKSIYDFSNDPNKAPNDVLVL